MKAYPTFNAKIAKDTIKPDNQGLFSSYLHNNFKIGQPVYVSVTPIHKIRSLKQNSYYWFYLQIIVDHTGDNIYDTHEFFKRKLLSPKFVTVMGKEVKLPASTTALSSYDFGIYIEKISSLTRIEPPTPDWEA